MYPNFIIAHLSINVDWIGGASVHFQFRFTVLCDLSHKRNSMPQIISFRVPHIIHFEKSTTKKWTQVVVALQYIPIIVLGLTFSSNLYLSNVAVENFRVSFESLRPRWSLDP